MSSIDYRLNTNFGVPYKLMEGYPKFTFDENGSIKSQERYLIDAGYLEIFAIESMPPPIILNDLIIRLPKRSMPGAPFLVTKSFSAEPFPGALPGDPFASDPTGIAAHCYDDTYVLTIEYETGKPSDFSSGQGTEPEEFLDASVSVGGEFLTWPSEGTTLTDDGGLPSSGTSSSAATAKGFGTPMVKIIPHMQISLKWKYVVLPPWTAIVNQLGKVNGSVHKYLLNLPAGCVLFMGVSGHQRFIWTGPSHQVWGPYGQGTPLGTPWELDFKFSGKIVGENGRIYGWNYVYHPKEGGWRKVTRVGGSPAYLPGDFDTLFKAGTLL